MKCASRRRWWASTTNTKSTLNLTVGTAKKSMATRSFAWLLRNACQVGDEGFSGRSMYLSTVDFATSIPSLRSSPTIRGDPQHGLARDILRMSCLTSGAVEGRPGLAFPLMRAQCSRKRSRCHAMTVRGCTNTRTLRQSDHTFDSHAHNRRSTGLMRGRTPDCWYTASWCRSARISNCIDRRVRKGRTTSVRKKRVRVFTCNDPVLSIRTGTGRRPFYGRCWAPCTIVETQRPH